MDLELLAMLQMDRNLSCNLRQLRLDHQMSVEEMLQKLRRQRTVVEIRQGV